MNFNEIKAIAVDIPVDDDRLTAELLSISEQKWNTGKDHYSGHLWKNIFLTQNIHKNFDDFKSAKLIAHSEWAWNLDLEIPYIKSLVESLPLKTIGMIRAFILEGPLVVHTDSNDLTPDDITYKLGLTIASKLNSPMFLDGQEVREKYVLFNDSYPHGFPTAEGQQISIRIFGDFDYDKFKVIKVYK